MSCSLNLRLHQFFPVVETQSTMDPNNFLFFSLVDSTPKLASEVLNYHTWMWLG